MLYKSIDIYRRLGEEEAMVYRCFELLPGHHFVVQSADRIRLPLRRESLQQHEDQFWELFCETAPEERAPSYPSLEEAIAAFDAEWGH